MKEADIDELQDFVADALNGHYPSAISDDYIKFKEDYGTISVNQFGFIGHDVEVSEFKEWMGEPNSNSTVKHKKLEEKSYVHQETIRADKFYSFRVKEAIKIKDTNLYIVISCDEISPLDVWG